MNILLQINAFKNLRSKKIKSLNCYKEEKEPICLFACFQGLQNSDEGGGSPSSWAASGLSEEEEAQFTPWTRETAEHRVPVVTAPDCAWEGISGFSEEVVSQNGSEGWEGTGFQSTVRKPWRHHTLNSLSKDQSHGNVHSLVQRRVLLKAYHN